MLYQVEADQTAGKRSGAPARRRRRASNAQTEPVHVPVAVRVSGADIIFSVPPGLGVDVDKKDSSILIVHPGSFFLDFTLANDSFKDPAILLMTTFGRAGVTPSGRKTVSLFNDNKLVKGEEQQVFTFQFSFDEAGLGDPTIVNTPDPA